MSKSYLAGSADHALTIAAGTGPIQNTPRTTPQDAQKAKAVPAPLLGARMDTSFTVDLQDGHMGFTVEFMGPNFLSLCFKY
jgi:hypothetical protein